MLLGDGYELHFCSGTSEANIGTGFLYQPHHFRTYAPGLDLNPDIPAPTWNQCWLERYLTQDSRNPSYLL